MSHSADQYKAMGNACMKNQDFTTAIDHYRNGLRLEPGNPILNCNLAQAYLNLKEYVEAEKFAKNAIENQENYTKAYFRAAKAALGRHNVYESMLYLARGVQNCSEENLEDLFCMAKDLSQEFETALRTYRDKTKPDRQKASTSLGANKQKQDSDGNGKLKEADIDKTEKGATKSATLSSKSQASKQVEGQGKSKKEIELEKAFKEVERKERLLEERERKDRELKENEKKERERRERERLKELEKERERKELQRKEQEMALKREAEKRKEEELIMLKAKAKEEKVACLKNELRDIMKDGSLALLKGLNRKAVESLKKALDIIHNHPPPEILGFGDHMDLVILQFAFCQALILSDEGSDVFKAIHILETLEKEGRHIKFPAILLLLGRAYIRLNRFKIAQQPLERGMSLLSRNSTSSRYSWPGTYEVIELTDRKFLKEALENDLQVCKRFHKPDAICFYEKCLDSSQHIVPSRNIFFSDPDFIGFVDISCQELCHVYFHSSCWKEYKEKLSEVEKLNEKDFLGQNCLTPDCKRKVSISTPSVITKVTIVGPDGEEKSSCEYTPPAPSPTLLVKECGATVRSPKKKQRKRENKMERINSKRTRQDSRSHGDVQQQISSTQEIFNGPDFKDALCKLVTARENNFGYDSEAPDAFKVSSVPEVSPLGKNEEFVYSYFLEIFKRDGYMSVFKLQEHWEGNKELLPVLEPALITHTDLVKFLLDTKGFAVVQDMIGIASELPNISTVVESKAELLPNVVPGWQLSPATAVEASKTLSFTSISNELETESERKDYKAEDIALKQNGFESGLGQYTDNSSCLIDTQASEDTKFMNASHPNFSEVLHVVESTQMIRSEDPVAQVTPAEELPPKNVVLNVGEDFNGNNVKCAISKEKPSAQEIKEGELHNHTSNSEDVKPEFQLQTQLEVLELNQDESKGEAASFTSSQDELSKKGKNQDGVVHHAEQSFDGNLDMQPEVQSHKKAAWKPRAKLMEWATAMFPEESPTKLWEALTLVRSQNNFTLSGLSFDVIAERVRCVLLETGDGDF